MSKKVKRIKVRNILRVANAMEKAADPQVRPIMGYNQAAPGTCLASLGFQDSSGHKCKTVGCVGGWVQAILSPAIDKPVLWDEALGIGERQSGELFSARPDTAQGHDPDIAQAVRTLRHLAKTGEVDWSIGK